MRACRWNSSAAATQLLLPAVHPELAEQRHGRAGLQLLQGDLRRRARGAGEVGDPFPGGDHAEARVARGQTLEERGEAGVLEPPLDLRPARRVLQRLDAVEDEQGALLPHQIGEARAAVVERAGLGVGIAEEAEGVVDERLGGGDLVLAPLAVERPVEHPRGPAPAVGRHAVQPAGDQRRLADASEGHQGEDVDGRVLPGGVEPGELRLAADEVRAGDGEAAEVEDWGSGRPGPLVEVPTQHLGMPPEQVLDVLPAHDLDGEQPILFELLRQVPRRLLERHAAPGRGGEDEASEVRPKALGLLDLVPQFLLRDPCP